MAITTSAPRVGQPLPPITLPSLNGRTISMSDYQGKRLLMFMWASW